MKAWTDGSCLGNPGPGGWAVVFSDGREAYGHQTDTTNNRMELTAIIEALRGAPPHEPLIVYSDSQLSVNILLGRWQATKNLDLVRQYRELAAQRQHATVLQWIRGHNGHTQNERADRLAQACARGNLKAAPSA